MNYMRFFRKISLTCGALLLFISAHAQFSNLIVFGDSLSDIGNFPESYRIYWDATKPKSIGNAIAQFYVPFSNPINTTLENPDGFPWPSLNDRYLSPQTKINGKARRYRSIGWSEFFLSYAKYKKQTDSDRIAPSTLLATQYIPANSSVNYAWGYATSFQHCVSPHYQQIKCTLSSIAKAKQAYLKNPSEKNYLKLEVPGLNMQIQAFLQDIKTKKVLVSKNSRYAIWIGGNDLIIAGNALEKHHNPLPAIALIFGETALHTMHGVESLLAALPNTEKPANIYLFTSYNPKLTPGFHHKAIAGFGNFVVKSSNFFLKFYSDIFNLFSSTKLVIVPIYDWYEQAASMPVFQKTLGQSCQMQGGDYDNVEKIPSDFCGKFLFWNDVHPAMPMQQRTAKGFFTVSDVLL